MAKKDEMSLKDGLWVSLFVGTLLAALLFTSLPAAVICAAIACRGK